MKIIKMEVCIENKKFEDHNITFMIIDSIMIVKGTYEFYRYPVTSLLTIESKSKFASKVLFFIKETRDYTPAEFAKTINIVRMLINDN